MTVAHQHALADPSTGAGIRCVLCDRVWPKDEMPLWHTWIMRATEPVVICHCEGTHKEPRWHGYDVVNGKGRFVATGVVCPQCIADKGLEAAVHAALYKAMCADKNTN